jgi:hypothetical protein
MVREHSVYFIERCAIVYYFKTGIRLPLLIKPFGTKEQGNHNAQNYAEVSAVSPKRFCHKP